MVAPESIYSRSNSSSPLNYTELGECQQLRSFSQQHLVRADLRSNRTVSILPSNAVLACHREYSYFRSSSNLFDKAYCLLHFSIYLPTALLVV